MKWAGMYLVGFVVLVGGLLAALWKLGILASIGTTWTLIGVVIAIGFGIMIAVSPAAAKKTSKSTGSERFERGNRRAALTRAQGNLA